MGLAALFTWIFTVLAGLYMLAVWLIEEDVTGRGAAPSRLPVPVIFSHLGLGVAGLTTWVAYLFTDLQFLAWAALGVQSGGAVLGAAMFARWIPVYRDPGPPPGMPQLAGAPGAVPAEGMFPVALVVAHGLLAVTTLVLVFLTVLGVGGK
jgi:hypothetical protein